MRKNVKEAMKQSSVTLTTLWFALRTFCRESFYSLRHVFQEYDSFRGALFRHHGKSFGIKILKEVHMAMKRHQTGVHVPGSFTPYSMWLRTDYTGLPRRLKGLRRLAVSRFRVLRMIAISITTAYTLYYDTPKVSLSTVLDPYLGVTESCSQEDPRYHHVHSFLRFIEWFVPKWFTLKHKEGSEIFLGVKGGPWGSPSFRYSLIDAMTLTRTEFGPILNSLREFSRLYNSDYLHNRLWWQFSYCSKCCEILSQFGFNVGVRPTDVPRIAKFSFLSEKGGKTRVITACNFWIQSVLFGLHNDVMRFLRKLDTDFTYDQERSAKFFRSQYEKGCRFAASFDMTGATDRFPAWVQQKILNCVKEKLGDLWRDLMSLPIYCEQTNSSHSFTVGQPMGVYSSFPVFSVSHHLVVRYSAWAVGLNPFHFNKYMILGDDVVIFHRRTARYYEYFLTQVLGVGLSTFKSLVTRRKSPFSAEFAKRLFVNSGERSPITPGILLSLRFGDSSLLVSILERVLVRWRAEIDVPSPDFVKVLVDRLLFRRRRTRALRWFTSPLVFPKWLPLEGPLLEVREKFWPFIDVSDAKSIWPIVERLRTDELLHDCVKRLSRLRDKSPALYQLPVRSNFFEVIRKVYFADNYLASFPLQDIIRGLQYRVERAFVDKNLSAKDLLILTRWLSNVLDYRVRVTGDVYVIKSRREIFESYRLHVLARDLMIRSPFGVMRVKGTPFIRPESWYT